MTIQALAPIDGPAVPALWGTTDARAIVQQAQSVALALNDVIRAQKLYVEIQGRDHIRVEGWTLLGSLVGVFPVCAWTRPLPDGAGWEARVEARTLAGAVVGAAEASCTRDERNWQDRDDFALRSMAQTRATSKALRLPLGFVVTLAGYDATPLEEIEGQVVRREPVQREPARRMYQAEAIAPSAGTRAPLAATEPQVKAINAIAGGALGWDEGQITHAARELFGVANVSDLSRRQASEFIDALKAQQSNEKAAGKSGGKRAPEPEPIDGEVSVDDLFPPE